MKKHVEAVTLATQMAMKGFELASRRHTSQGVEVTGSRNGEEVVLLVSPCEEREDQYVVDVSINRAVAQRRGNGGATPVDAINLAQLNNA